MIQVIEVDQWTSSGNISNLDFDSVGLNDITGGDSESAKAIFGGWFVRKMVDDNVRPDIGNVWYIRDEATGKCKMWKYSYDTSG